MAEREREIPQEDDNGSPDDGAWENELTEEDYPTPAERADVADTQPQDP